MQFEGGRHAEHAMPFYDPEEGVTCGCGEVIGTHFKDWDDPSEPPWDTTADEAAEPTSDEKALAVVGPDEDQESELVTTGRGLVQRVVDPIMPGIDLIDPTQPYGPKEVEEHILDATARLERGMVFEAGLVAAAEDAEMRHTLALNRALAQQHGGSERDRLARASVQVEDQYIAMMQARIARDAMRSTTHSLRSVLSSYQSVSKSVQATYGAANHQPQGQRRNDGSYF